MTLIAARFGDRVKRFATFNATFSRYCRKDAPSRVFMFIRSWPDPFDIEMDWVAGCERLWRAARRITRTAEWPLLQVRLSSRNDEECNRDIQAISTCVLSRRLSDGLADRSLHIIGLCADEGGRPREATHG